MTKRVISLLLVAVLALGILAGCGSKKALTADQAQKLVFKDLGVKESQVDSVDYHVVTQDGVVCYLVFISVGDEHWQYSVAAATGEILEKTQADHAHSH